MNAHTKISGKGQVVVPKAARDRLGWSPGTDLEVVETSDAVILRRQRPAKTLTIDEAIGRLRAIYTHRGPAASLEQMRSDAREAASRAVTTE